LIESELFGHQRGSFAGADRMHRGAFEQAHRGTLLLDEVSEMPLDLQVRLLRVLETGTLTRAGGTETVRVDVRVIAASNRRPEEAVAAGQLREDLLYRLSVFPIPLPPLRERGGDVELLASHFLAELNREKGVEKRFTAPALVRLHSHAWPGNVRELRNVVRRAFIVSDETIGADALPLPAGAVPAGGEVAGGRLLFRPGTRIADVEKALIVATLEHFDQDKRRTAQALGISLKTLYNRLNEYGRGRSAKGRPPLAPSRPRETAGA
jgi:two-component system response regulator AtoC